MDEDVTRLRTLIERLNEVNEAIALNADVATVLEGVRAKAREELDALMQGFHRAEQGAQS